MIPREADRPPCPQCKSQDLICVGLLREVTFFRCDNCNDVFEVPSAAHACDSQKPKRPKREDTAQPAFRALQHVIDTAEGKKRTPKRKPH